MSISFGLNHPITSLMTTHIHSPFYHRSVVDKLISRCYPVASQSGSPRTRTLKRKLGMTPADGKISSCIARWRIMACRRQGWASSHRSSPNESTATYYVVCTPCQPAQHASTDKAAVIRTRDTFDTPLSRMATTLRAICGSRPSTGKLVL